jgi:L-2,4-diaminobutyric acid acetyltransferase
VSTATPTLTLRAARVEDGPAIHSLVVDTGVLDVNSRYAYLAHCRHFGSTTPVAVDDDGALAGFVTAHLPPDQPDVVFVWQVGVAGFARGQGLATRLLGWLLAQPACVGVRELQTTITPDNAASHALFRGLARKLGTDCVVEEGFSGRLLGEGHAPEELFRIGPLTERT